MYRIVRGLFYMDPSERAAAADNYDAVRKDRLLQLSPREERVLDWLMDFRAKHGEAPSHQIAHDYFERANAPDETALIEEAMANTFRARGTFRETFEEVVQHQGVLAMRGTMKEALEIAVDGKPDPRTGELIRGVERAAAHLYSNLRTPAPPDAGRVPSRLADAAGRLRSLYDERKSNPASAFGIMTGYTCLDSRVGGVRRKQLYIHAGFANHLKSTFSMNLAVNAVVRGYNVLFFSAEMDATDLFYLAVAIHSGNPKFRKPGTSLVLDSKDLVNGTLSRPELEDQFDLVRNDLADSPDHGTLRIIDSSEFSTFGSVMQRTVREHSVEPVDVLWVDYLTRLPLDAKYARTDHVHGMNLTIAEAKQFAMSFGDGQGLAVCTPFQVNREGMRRAKTNGGRLDATHLGQYNAAEKEADWITYTWFGEVERRESSCKLGMIKSRHSELMLDPVDLYYDEHSRRIEETLTARGTPNLGPGGYETIDGFEALDDD